MSIPRISFGALLLAGMLLPGLPAAANDKEEHSGGSKTRMIQETYAGSEDNTVALQPVTSDDSREMTPRVIHGYENH